MSDSGIEKQMRQHLTQTCSPMLKPLTPQFLPLGSSQSGGDRLSLCPQGALSLKRETWSLSSGAPSLNGGNAAPALTLSLMEGASCPQGAP